MIPDLLRTLRQTYSPLAILVVAIAIVASALSLPPTLSGLKSVLPLTLMFAGAALAAWSTTAGFSSPPLRC